uniref:Uncharacterized protein n=1 Tax=Anguilla anguilla TaxID=7936 RepID=A0A0E9Y256_ANGAN
MVIVVRNELNSACAMASEGFSGR